MTLDLPTNKVVDLLSTLVEKSELEELGRMLRPIQLAAVWQKAVKLWPSNDSRLAALLVGVTPAVFTATLALLTDEQLKLLKNHGLNEPLLHHLTLYTHSLEKIFTETYFHASALQQRMTQQTPQQFAAQLSTVYQEITQLQHTLEQLKRDIDRILGIAWSYERGELVDKLSVLKENCEHTLSSQTGLYHQAEQHLSSIFGLPGRDEGALHDDDPALEALAKLSIWYLEDFYEIGLLPQARALQIEGHLALKLVEERLSQVGLHTVGDIKKHSIYSRQALQAFLERF